MSDLWLPLLLADPSPTLRGLVLRDLLHKGADDPEVQELAEQRGSDPLISELLVLQSPAGYWTGGGLSAGKGAIQGTAQALLRLAYCGYGPEFSAVARSAEFLFAQQEADGSWPLNNDLDPGERYANYEMIPLQTAMPLRALAAAGYARDPRAEKAYEWLLAQRLEDGAWPTGKAGGANGFVAGYRRLPHSRWGCRSNTTGALLCLAYHPRRRYDPAARRALDLLLGRETRERQSLGFEVARIIGAEKAGGVFTYYARFDLALMLDLCRRVGASLADPRIAALVAAIRADQGPYGMWEYLPQPQVSRWLTFDLLRSLAQIDQDTAWISLEPQTPFQPYRPQEKRY